MCDSLVSGEVTREDILDSTAHEVDSTTDTEASPAKRVSGEVTREDILDSTAHEVDSTTDTEASPAKRVKVAPKVKKAKREGESSHLISL